MGIPAGMPTARVCSLYAYTLKCAVARGVYKLVKNVKQTNKNSASRGMKIIVWMEFHWNDASRVCGKPNI